MQINAAARLAVAWLTMFLVGTELFVFSPLLPVLAANYHIAPSLAGLSVTMFSLAYMVSAPLFGYFSDRIGRRRVLICSLVAFALANILTAGAANLPSLLAVRLFAGAAAAGVSPSIYALVDSAAPPDRRATWLALVAPVSWSRLQSGRRRAAWWVSSSAVRRYSLRSPASVWCWSG